MKTKKNNHLLPRMVIKRWKENNGKIYDKEKNKIRNVIESDYSKEYYYSLGKVDDKLENRISFFEAYIANILEKLNKSTDSFEISKKDLEILKLYVVLQSCRNNNTSSYITADESGMYQNNNYLFGVPLINTQEEAVELTSSICSEFERIKKGNTDTRVNCVPLKENLNLLSYCYGLHLVIVGNDNDEFLISETTAVIECTMDGDYLFTYVPISPKRGLILAKSKYFYTKKDIEDSKKRLGFKYGPTPDPYLSVILNDEKLIFNGIPNKDTIILSIVKLDPPEIITLNSVIYQDGQLILFSNEDALNRSKVINPSRKIVMN